MFQSYNLGSDFKSPYGLNQIMTPLCFTNVNLGSFHYYLLFVQQQYNQCFIVVYKDSNSLVCLNITYGFVVAVSQLKRVITILISVEFLCAIQGLVNSKEL